MTHESEAPDGSACPESFLDKGDIRFLFVEGYLSPYEILKWEQEGKLRAQFDSDGTKFFLAEDIEKIVQNLEEALCQEAIFSNLKEILDRETQEIKRIEACISWREAGSDDFEVCLEYAKHLLRVAGHDPDFFTLHHPACDWLKREGLQADPLDNAWMLPFIAVDTKPMPVGTRIGFPNGHAALVAEEVELPVVVHQDYEALDRAMLKAEYQIDESLSGWIATMPLEMAEAQAEELNKKLEEVVRSGKIFCIGFNQTGNFAVGYTIYIKEAEFTCHTCEAAIDQKNSDCESCNTGE